MKKLLSVVLAVMMAVTGFSAFGINAFAEETKNGWVKEQAAYYYEAEDRMIYFDYDIDYYYINGVKATGFQVIDGKKYYFNSNGWVEKGLFYVDDVPYYSDENGVVQTNCWQDVDMGAPEEGYSYILRFCFGSDGAGYMGWKKMNNEWYHFGESDSVFPGALDRAYYYDEATGKAYFFNDDGVMLKNCWVKIDYTEEIEGFIDWFYVGSNGVVYTGWHKIKGTWYYFDKDFGNMNTGWQKINKKWYYFKKSGAMVTGWQKIGKKWYYFNSSGVMKTGWLKLKGKWYYLDANGAMVTGSRKIGKKNYKFNSSGVCQNP